MKKLTSFLLVLTIVFIGCDEESQSKIANIKTVSHRIKDLGKSSGDIKQMEDEAALMKEDEYILEYEYPIREEESYVITYRFKNDACFEIKLDTYLNKESYAVKVQKEIMADIANNKAFGKTKLEVDIYTWESDSEKIKLNTHHVERGTLNLTITTK